MTEQLAVGEIASRRRAVVGEEHGRAAVRSEVNGEGDKLFAGSAFTGDQHREVVALKPLNLLDDPRHDGTRAQKSRQQRLEQTIHGCIDGSGRSVARGAEGKALTRHRYDHSQSPHDRVADRPR